MNQIQRMQEIVKACEGLRLKSYICPAGHPTIGYGRVIPDLNSPRTCTKEQAEQWFLEDWASHWRGVVSTCSGTTGQLAALTSFSFNLGLGRLRGSTLLRRHRTGEFRAAALQFLRWVYGGGKVLPGLIKRRKAESIIYMEQQ